MLKTKKAERSSNPNEMIKLRTKCRLMDDNLLVQPYEPPQMLSAGGILLIQERQETSMKQKPNGYVLATGPGKLLMDGTRVPVDARVGDRIVFSSGAGQEIRFDGHYLKIVRGIDVLMVLE